MAKISIERVVALPAPEALAPSTMYVVKGADSDIAELYFTSNNGQELRHLVNKADINAMIASQVASFNNLLLTPTIASRNALELDKNTLVLVQDATGDPTVNSGAALYFFDSATSSFTKVSEYESLDVTLEWSAIANRPQSSVEAIDAAVANSHSHNNSAVLDLLGQNGDGELTFNGQPIGAAVVVADW